ncbi:hypothetical protein GOODEAATRI_031311 [Goodea atripinnis]|uniref:Uncharacterized protein n=1 Tax=Goodea atripinnis TaxID=208336 RepID=A0ABV0PIN4_9TELE
MVGVYHCNDCEGLSMVETNTFCFKDDFSGPAESTTFPLGSMIPIMASVEQVTHQPLLVLLEECVYIHCTMAAWDPNGLDNTKKACHYVKDHG